jgi:hypothetical protein
MRSSNVVTCGDAVEPARGPPLCTRPASAAHVVPLPLLPPTCTAGRGRGMAPGRASGAASSRGPRAADRAACARS